MHKDGEVVHVMLGYLKNSWGLDKWLEGYATRLALVPSLSTLHL